jgi:surfeit locus 1 family protein
MWCGFSCLLLCIFGAVIKQQFLSLFLLFVLLALGCWQLYRHQWKEEVIASYELTKQLSPLPITKTSDILAAAYREYIVSNYHDARACGEVAPVYYEKQFGRVPLFCVSLADDSHLLVAIGFVADGQPTPALPQIVHGISLPLGSAPAFYLPQHNLLQKQFRNFDGDALRAAFGISQVLMILQPPSPALPYLLAPQFRRDHLHYAFTWFALAAAWLLVYVLRVKKGGTYGSAA